MQGPEKFGYETPLWTCPRVADLIEREFGVSYHAGHVWKILRQLNWSPQRPKGRALERNEEAIAEWKHKTWPAIKKKAQKEGRTIVFIDERGLASARIAAARGRRAVKHQCCSIIRQTGSPRCRCGGANRQGCGVRQRDLALWSLR